MKKLILLAFNILCLSGITWGDSLSVVPDTPTTLDSCRFTISFCAGSINDSYLYDSTLVTLIGDSAIMLSYKCKYFAGPIICYDCPCNVSLVYKHGPLAAGKYSVWEKQCEIYIGEPCCMPADVADTICTDSPTVQKIGDFTVQLPSAIKFKSQTKVPAFARQPVPVKLYDLSGRCIDKLSVRKFGVYIATYGQGNLVKKLMVGD